MSTRSAKSSTSDAVVGVSTSDIEAIVSRSVDAAVKVMKECLASVVKELFDRILKLEEKLILSTCRKDNLNPIEWPLPSVGGPAVAGPAAVPTALTTRSQPFQPPPPRLMVPKTTLRGKSCSSSTSTSIRAVPRRLHAFVTRLHIDTTEEDLTNWLKEKGVTAVKCKRIVPKDGRQFDTAAFHVSCDLSATERFYDEDSWPDGAEMRDWIFRQPQFQANDVVDNRNG